MMLAHVHGQLWNASKIAESLGVSPPTVRHYLDILQDTFMVRALQPYFTDLKKRLVKSPKIFLRDTGLLHALLRLGTDDDILAHPIAGTSWEGFVLEQILANIPSAWEAYFYRTRAGAEMDLVLVPGGRRRPIAVEMKLSLAPTPSRGFWNAVEDLNPARSFVIYPGTERYLLRESVFVLPIAELHEIWDE